MRVQLAQQAQEILGQSDLVVITERVDDVALLIGQMVQMGFVEVLDRPSPRHGKQRRVSWGWTAVIGLAYILTEGDHRQVSVEAYIKGLQHTLGHLRGQDGEPLDCSDDRWAHLLTPLRKPQDWHGIEQDWNARRREVYAVSQDVIRCDAPPVSGTHDVTETGLRPCGQRQDDPSRPQLTVLVGSMAPLGMPLATAVLSGERADEGLYSPLLKRLEAGVSQTGLLCVGACQRSALGTRAYITGRQHVYRSPLPLTGTTADARVDGSSAGMAQAKDGALERVFRRNHREEEVLAAEGDEGERMCGLEDSDVQWRERVLVLRSPVHAERQVQGLETRLAHAEKKRAALTPARGRGKRQLTEEAPLVAAMDQVLTAQRVEGLLCLAWEQQRERHTHYVGRGRGSATRARRVTAHIRSHITRIVRQEAPIADLPQRFGWQACVTNAPKERRSLADAVLCYRNAYRVERLCNRLKSRLQIAPLFVTLDDQLEGLPYLLTLGVRVVTVMEFVLRRSLQHDHVQLPGLHPENRPKMPDTPTAERLLKTFSDVSLTILRTHAGEDILRRLTPLSALQQDIRRRLDLGIDRYRQLEIQNMGS
jgi:transposase